MQAYGSSEGAMDTTPNHQKREKHDAHHGDVHHITSPWVYLAVFVALVIGTIITVWVAFHDFGMWNKPIALGIAVIKSTLVVLYFMHVRHSGRLTVAVIVIALAMLSILIAFTASDYLTRGSKNIFYNEDPPAAGAAHDPATVPVP
jgi:cytochrome c oxidase subunit 4